MRKWRVGSISMGAALIMLGVIVMLAQFNEWNETDILLTWFPLILVILGVEIVLYISMSKQEQPVVKYDILSIIFITCLGGIALILFISASTGVLEMVKTTVQAEEVEGTLPAIEHPVNQEVKKVVLESAEAVTVETNNTSNIHIFGTYQSSSINMEKGIKPGDVAAFHQVGDTLYVEMLQAPTRPMFGYDDSEFSATVSIPGDIETEVRSWVAAAHLNLANMKNNWSLTDVDQVYLTDTDNADVKLTTEDVWEEEAASNQTNTFGEGTHQLQIDTANQLHIQ
ncbi:hypothetical protein [Sediminibacillus albus]|uniref:DUF5668 domain-containing protein n=1 Tax=Sediminibacillus albus TaxID=407036 RepID=A0A1G8ZR55_9BACI|nr:hypothetical protein [Sediminibacillus albus]SDK17537.1 hypothetical protein SAMN05216243_2175 [Sediminibacillus albus]